MLIVIVLMLKIDLRLEKILQIPMMHIIIALMLKIDPKSGRVQLPAASKSVGNPALAAKRIWERRRI